MGLLDTLTKRDKAYQDILNQAKSKVKSVTPEKATVKSVKEKADIVVKDMEPRTSYMPAHKRKKMEDIDKGLANELSKEY
jgi:hypothetical protein